MLRLLSRLLPEGKDLLSQCLALVHTRLELQALQLLLAKQRLLDALIFLLLAWLLGAIGLALLSALVILWAWESYRWPALALLGSLYFLGSLGLLRKARQIFQATGRS